MSLVIILILTFFLGASRFAGRSFAVNKQITDPTRIYKYLFVAAVFLIFALLIFQSFQQYWAWERDELAKNLLPPYQDINYFIFYIFTRFFASYLISLAVALVFLFSAKILNKKCEERFFYPEEIYLGASAIFLTGHPGWLFYVILLLTVYVLIQLFFVAKYFRLRRIPRSGTMLNTQYSSPRISLYWLWIPTAIFVILIQRWLEILSLWQVLKF